LYFDLGYLGIALGMALVGVGTRALSTYFRRDRDPGFTVLLYALTLPLLLLLMRGNFPDTMSRGLFLLGPVILAGLVSRRLPRRA
jgi:hypothetical protein